MTSDMNGTLPPPSWPGILGQWELRPVWDLLIVAAACAYLWALFSARRRGERAWPVHPARVAAFIAGLILLVISLNSAVQVYSRALFWDHMIQHLLLIMGVPALLVAGQPLTVFLAAASPKRRGHLLRILRSRPISVLTHPVVGFSIYSVVLVGTHLTSFMDQMMLHPWLGPVEQALYLTAGYLFLLPLVADEPIRWKPPQLLSILLFLIAMAPDTVVGVVLLQANHDVFPVMEHSRPSWALPAVDDLHIAGGIMWAFGDGFMMAFAVWIILSLITQHQSDSLGNWLENIRRENLNTHLAGDGTPAALDHNVDLDSDDAALDAYNRMLARLNAETAKQNLGSSD